jgi:multiple sugar transport system substrate-binding protein
MTRLSRRRLGLAAAALAASPGAARAQAATLNAFGHRVHQIVTNGAGGGDVTAAWRAANKAEINWITLGEVGPIHDRIQRELALNETSLDLVHVLNGFASPRLLAQLEPLDPYMRDQPIEDFADISPGMVAPLKLDGALRAVPMRHTTNALIWNQALFEERGIAGPPKTFEELVDTARKLTFKRPDGSQVHGMVFHAGSIALWVSCARAFNGDFMTLDAKVVCDQPPAVKALSVLAELQREEVLPRGMTGIALEEITTWMQQGRAAMTMTAFARIGSLNDPANSRYPGKIKAASVPMTAELAGKVPFATTFEFWSYAIPKNSKNKALTWSLVRALSSKEGTLKMALNGNGPVRGSTYSDPAFAKDIARATIEAQALREGRIPLPAFDNQARANDVFIEECQAALLGMKPPQQAMGDAARRVQALL